MSYGLRHSRHRTGPDASGSATLVVEAGEKGRTTMIRLAVILMCCAAVLLGCSRDDGVNRVTPDRIAVAEGVPPRPGDGVYFNFSVGRADDPRPILEQILDAGMDLTAAWQPRDMVLCAAMGAREALVVEIDGPAPGIGALGFVADPEPWLPNCGISRFWEYRPVN